MLQGQVLRLSKGLVNQENANPASRSLAEPQLPAPMQVAS